MKHIPNLFTLGNLFCGTLATIFAVQGNFESTALFVVIGIFFDFLDGFIARLLKVTGELGKQLDSLADMVTSGVVPGIVMYQLLNENTIKQAEESIRGTDLEGIVCFGSGYHIYLGLLLTLGACYRLAKFNIDTRQSDSFIGLPTPAMSLFVISLPLIQMHTDISFVQNLIANNYFLIVITFVLSFLMNAEIPLFSLKFKGFGFQKNFQKYLFLIVSMILIFTLQFLSVPLIILLYVLMSLIFNYGKKVTF